MQLPAALQRADDCCFPVLYYHVASIIQFQAIYQHLQIINCFCGCPPGILKQLKQSACILTSCGQMVRPAQALRAPALLHAALPGELLYQATGSRYMSLELSGPEEVMNELGLREVTLEDVATALSALLAPTSSHGFSVEASGRRVANHNVDDSSSTIRINAQSAAVPLLHRELGSKGCFLLLAALELLAEKSDETGHPTRRSLDQLRQLPLVPLQSGRCASASSGVLLPETSSPISSSKSDAKSDSKSSQQSPQVVAASMAQPPAAAAVAVSSSSVFVGQAYGFEHELAIVDLESLHALEDRHADIAHHFVSRLGVQPLNPSSIIHSHILPRLEELTQQLQGADEGAQSGTDARQPEIMVAGARSQKGVDPDGANGSACEPLLDQSLTTACVGYAAFLLHHQHIAASLAAELQQYMVWVVQSNGDAPGSKTLCSMQKGLHLAEWLLEDTLDDSSSVAGLYAPVTALQASGAAGMEQASAPKAAASPLSAFKQLCEGVIELRMPSFAYLRYGSRTQWANFCQSMLRHGCPPLFSMQSRVDEPSAATLLDTGAVTNDNCGPLMDYQCTELQAVLAHNVPRASAGDAAAVQRLCWLASLLDRTWAGHYRQYIRKHPSDTSATGGSSGPGLRSNTGASPASISDTDHPPPSSFLKLLTSTAWVPLRNGSLVLPCAARLRTPAMLGALGEEALYAQVAPSHTAFISDLGFVSEPSPQAALDQLRVWCSSGPSVKEEKLSGTSPEGAVPDTEAPGGAAPAAASGDTSPSLEALCTVFQYLQQCLKSEAASTFAPHVGGLLDLPVVQLGPSDQSSGAAGGSSAHQPPPASTTDTVIAAFSQHALIGVPVSSLASTEYGHTLLRETATPADGLNRSSGGDITPPQRLHQANRLTTSFGDAMRKQDGSSDALVFFPSTELYWSDPSGVVCGGSSPPALDSIYPQVSKTAHRQLKQ